MGLPPEIRCIIYDFLLRPRKPIEFRDLIGVTDKAQLASTPSFANQRQADTLRRNRRAINNRVMFQVAILRVCRKIYAEAVPFLYGQRVFRFNEPAWEFIDPLQRIASNLSA